MLMKVHHIGMLPFYHVASRVAVAGEKKTWSIMKDVYKTQACGSYITSTNTQLAKHKHTLKEQWDI